MFLAIAKFLYLDLKQQKLKMPDPTNEMEELEQGSKKVSLTAKAPAVKKDCKC